LERIALLERQLEESRLLRKRLIDGQGWFADSSSTGRSSKGRNETRYWEGNHTASYQPLRDSKDRKTRYGQKEIPSPSRQDRISQEEPQRDDTYRKKKVRSQQQRFQEYNEDENEYLQHCNIFDQVAPTKQSDLHERADVTFSILEQ
jgi:hypothetical protein